MHARFGARKGLCTGLMDCGGVLVQIFKVQVIPTRKCIAGKVKVPAAKTSRAAHTCRSWQRRAGDGVYGWNGIKIYS